MTMKTREDAERIVAEGSDVHPSCGIELARELGLLTREHGANTIHAGTCAWCGEHGGVSTVLDYFENAWWD